MNSEIKSRKWLWGGIGLQFATGYIVAFLVYQIGTLVTEGVLGDGFVPGLIVVAAIVVFVVYLIHKADQGLLAEYTLRKKNPLKEGVVL
jgi:ferrous iron transport protein B